MCMHMYSETSTRIILTRRSQRQCWLQYHAYLSLIIWMQVEAARVAIVEVDI